MTEGGGKIANNGGKQNLERAAEADDDTTLRVTLLGWFF